MNTLLLIADMIFAFLCAYNAGMLKTCMDIDRIEGKPLDKTRAFLAVGNTLCSIYMIIAIYGMGLKHG